MASHPNRNRGNETSKLNEDARKMLIARDMRCLWSFEHRENKSRFAKRVSAWLWSNEHPNGQTFSGIVLFVEDGDWLKESKDGLEWAGSHEGKFMWHGFDLFIPTDRTNRVDNTFGMLDLHIKSDWSRPFLAETEFKQPPQPTKS